MGAEGKDNGRIKTALKYAVHSVPYTPDLSTRVAFHSDSYTNL